MELLEQAPSSPIMSLLLFPVHVLSLLLLYWSYRALSRKLIQLTGAADRPPDDPTLLPDPASDASSQQRQ